MTLLALFGVLGGVFAQTYVGYKPIQLAAAAEGYYVIDAVDQNNINNHHFIYDNNGTFATATSIDANNFNNYVWHITQNGEKYNFQNVGTNKYITIGTGNGNGQNMTLTNDAFDIAFDFANGFAALGNGNNQWYDCGNRGDAASTWSDGVTGSRRMRVYEVVEQAGTYTMQCKKNSPYAVYNANATEGGVNHLAKGGTTVTNEAKFIIESTNNGFFYIRIAGDANKYVYAINTEDANSNVGVSELGDSETGAEDKYLWNLNLNTEGYYNPIPKGGEKSWNCRGTVNSVPVLGLWSNDTDDDRWAITEVDPIFSVSTPGTFYVTFTGQTSDRPNYLYNDLTQSDGYTLQAQTQPNPLTNNFIWKVVSDGNGNFTSLLNGQGNTMKVNSGSKPTINALQYEAHNGSFYLKTNASGIANSHNCLNVANTGYQNAAGTNTLTTWSTTSGPNAADNHWAIDVVNTTGLTEYTVSVPGGEGYAIYNGQNAANGGFFLASSISEGDVQTSPVPGYKGEVSIDNNVITITYSPSVTVVEATLTDANGQSYVYTYNGERDVQPEVPGAVGLTFSNENWTESAKDGIDYEYTATIAFPFPVDASTGIQSEIGSSKWYAKDGKVLANNSANTLIYTSNEDSYKWMIIPSFVDGAFSFKLKNVATEKYIPADASTGLNTATTLVDEANAGSFYFCHINTGDGFATSLTSNKFLTINTSGTNQNIWIWSFNGSSTHTGSNMTFPEITATIDDVTINANFAALAGLQKFTLVEGATVISPSEYAAPVQINAAIDAYNAVEDNVEAKAAFLTSDNGNKLTAFKNASTSYGAPLEFTWSIKANKWGTIFSPVNFTKPAELTLYTCAGASDEGVLNIQTSGSAKNTPFLVKNTSAEDKTYQIIGYSNGAATQNTKLGLLTGVIEENSKVPSGSYILATKEGTQAFYRVDTENYTAAVNKCYITMPGASTVKALLLSEDGVETAIESLDAETVNGAIYNIAGQKLSKLQKGINIVGGKKIFVK